MDLPDISADGEMLKKKFFFKSSFTTLISLCCDAPVDCINSYHQKLNRIPGVEECDSSTGRIEGKKSLIVNQKPGS